MNKCVFYEMVAERTYPELKVFEDEQVIASEPCIIKLSKEVDEWLTQGELCYILSEDSKHKLGLRQ
jgi:hypothetical protein